MRGLPHPAAASLGGVFERRGLRPAERNHRLKPPGVPQHLEAVEGKWKGKERGSERAVKGAVEEARKGQWATSARRVLSCCQAVTSSRNSHSWITPSLLASPISKQAAHSARVRFTSESGAAASHSSSERQLTGRRGKALSFRHGRRWKHKAKAVSYSSPFTSILPKNSRMSPTPRSLAFARFTSEPV